MEGGLGRRPSPEPHAYGANGLRGRVRRPLKEPIASHAFFVVRQDSRKADVLFQTADTTWQAYNTFGSNSSMYGSFEPGVLVPRALKASYNRPLATRGHRAVNAPFHAEYPAIRWLERNGYDVQYISGVDADRLGAAYIAKRRVFLG